MGKVLAAQQKRSLLPTGRAIRAAVWQRLAPMPIKEIDRLELWQIGAMLNTHMVDKPLEEKAEADRIMAERARKIGEVQDREKDVKGS